MRVTVVTPYLPHDRVGHGGGISIRSMITHLARSHEVTVVSLLRPGEDALVEKTGADLGATVVTIPFLDAGAPGRLRPALLGQRGFAMIRALLHGHPYYVRKYGSPRLIRDIVKAVAASCPDAVQIEYLQMALVTKGLRRWRDGLRKQGKPAPGLFASSHELASLPRSRQAALSRNPLRKFMLAGQAAAWRRLERNATTWSDRTFCVTAQDRDLLVGQGGVNCRTIPLGIDTERVRQIWQDNDSGALLFVGSFSHGPNRQAAGRLVTNILPRLRMRGPEPHLSLVGRGSAEFLSTLPGNHTRVSAVGFADSLDTYYRDSRLFIAPLSTGGGIKIKILEAMAAGIPIVTTPIGAEGIVSVDDRAIWIADTDDAFVGAVEEALGDRPEAARRAARARAIIEDRFSWRVIAETLGEEYALFQAR